MGTLSIADRGLRLAEALGEVGAAVGVDLSELPGPGREGGSSPCIRLDVRTRRGAARTRFVGVEPSKPACCARGLARVVCMSRPDRSGSTCFLVSPTIAYRALNTHVAGGTVGCRWRTERWRQRLASILLRLGLFLQRLAGPRLHCFLRRRKDHPPGANWNTFLGAACFPAMEASDTPPKRVIRRRRGSSSRQSRGRCRRSSAPRGMLQLGGTEIVLKCDSLPKEQGFTGSNNIGSCKYPTGFLLCLFTVDT